MIIRLLALQRPVRYGGEYAPEVLAVVDENTMDENPKWWPEAMADQKARLGPNAGEFAEIEVVLDDEALASAFGTTRIAGKIR